MHFSVVDCICLKSVLPCVTLPTVFDYESFLGAEKTSTSVKIFINFNVPYHMNPAIREQINFRKPCNCIEIFTQDIRSSLWDFIAFL